ncbi:MAG TPA: EAL domain-containing protein [Blastocatellia bacterium]|nr:EAL domain-containing protein [Blastocatellia bacterium]
MRDRCLLDLILEPGALTVLFQPILEYGQGRWRLNALECLVRGPKGTNLETANVLFEYGRRKRAESLVDRACVAAILEEARALPPSWDISLNVHASTLGRDAEFPAYLSQLADNYSIPLSRITVEIVEHTPCWDRPVFFNALNDLRKAGARIALDDFGFGQSNYQMVIDCMPEKIKVDRFIVKGCHADDCRQAIIESVALFARRSGAQLIAEGVENVADLQTVMSLGVSRIQGFLFFRPLSLTELLGSNPGSAENLLYSLVLHNSDLAGLVGS